VNICWNPQRIEFICFR